MDFHCGAACRDRVCKVCEADRSRPRRPKLSTTYVGRVAGERAPSHGGTNVRASIC